MADIDIYKEALKKLSDENSTEYINNSSIDHAAAMIERLMLQAQGTMRIFTDHLKASVYNRPDVKKAAFNFLEKKDNKMVIMMQLNDPEDDAREENLSKNGFLVFLEKYKSQITVYKTIDKKLKSLNKHFMVITTKDDKHALRFEVDTDKHIATGTFNDKDFGEKLIGFFDKYNICDNVSRIDADMVWA